MTSTAGGISQAEVAYKLPYSVGLQYIWDAKVANGELIAALVPDRKKASANRFKRLMG
tara:strand:- start:166 stop:339 length:174 start_codon:yes stop_codon:yes gene_type:complete